MRWGVTTTGVCFRLKEGVERMRAGVNVCAVGRDDDCGLFQGDRMRAGVNVCAMGRDHDWGLLQGEGGR